MFQGKKPIGALVVVALLIGLAGIAGAGVGIRIRGGESGNKAMLRCDGGMSSLAHVFDEDASLFPGDPAVEVEILATIAEDFFLLEHVATGTHTSTHLDAPGHFIEGARTVDQLAAEEFVWPAYVIDVRDRIERQGPEFQLTRRDLRRYEREAGRIPRGALVVLRTGQAEKWATPGYVDDAFPGFDGAAVQWMFDRRGIGAVGSDSLGPDASFDDNFDATFTALANDGVTVPGLTNLDSLAMNRDIVIAPAIPLRDGSGYQVNPLACHAGGRGGNGDDGDDRRDRDDDRDDDDRDDGDD